MRGEHTNGAPVRPLHRQGDVDEFHRLPGGVGQQLGQQHGLVHVTDEAALDAALVDRPLGDVHPFQHAVAGGQDQAVGVGEADPGDVRQLVLQAVQQGADLADVVRLTQGLQLADDLQQAGAVVHVAVQPVDHLERQLRQALAEFLAHPLARALADQRAEQPAQGTHQQGDGQGDAATQAVGATHGEDLRARTAGEPADKA